MLKIISKLIPFRIIKLIFRLMASMASAIVIVSGYLLLVSNDERNRESDTAFESDETDDKTRQEMD
ncbi:MAG: hypothetical protein HQ517_15260 [SAR324 cluster bacterium]|nr:hypothetical protein [SAR324 cluster bacterium]